MADSFPSWIPDPERAAASHLAAFRERLVTSGHLVPRNPDKIFAELHQWSIDHPQEFWERVWVDGGVIADAQQDGRPWHSVLVGGDRMAPPDPDLGPRWFTGSRLNYAENLLRHGGDNAALVSWDESGHRSNMSWDELRTAVAAAAAAFRQLGVVAGDRVAGWLPNGPHAIVSMLAASSLGAVWTSCSPDFGTESVLDRFGQTEPVVLIFCNGYRYGGKIHDCTTRAAELLQKLPSVRHAVMVTWGGDASWSGEASVMAWDAFLELATDCTLSFTRLPFDHPLYILYSSGTTGLPKCMVHGAGGTLLQHLKELRLHCDLHEGERLFYFTTCGWMMWNWMVSGLAAGATLVLYDGAPLPGVEPDLLWRMAQEEVVNVFGTSAKYLAMCEKHDLRPADRYQLQGIRTILSTGSPLAPESFDWIADAVGKLVQVASISGGTDIVSCFVLGNPLSPVYRGEIQGPGLGLAVDVFNSNGESCGIGEPGELVCRQPFPSMPVCFWNDEDQRRYRAAYFERFPGVWCHGDWIVRTPSGGFVISGRSDATLNPGGVRIGTAEIYRQVEAVPEVMESLVIGQRVPDGDVRVVLFLRMREGNELTPRLEAVIRQQIRQGASPHHVPRIILAAPDLPRTRSGKLSELAVRDVVEGRAVANAGALANPEALEWFRNRAELR